MSTAAASPDKCIITCALTGALANRDQCPHLPYTPAELGEEARRAYEAGATLVHIHAREDDGTPSFRPEVFARIREEVTRRSPILLNFSTGSLDDDTSQQEAYIRASRPHLAALNMGTMNYAKYSPKRKEFVFDTIFPNTFGKIVRLLRAMNDAGVKPELECFDTGHTASIGPLLDMGVLKQPIQFSFIMGVLGGVPPSPEALRFQSSQVPAGSTWEVIGIGRSQWRMVATALTIGGNIRVGLEDNFYLPEGRMATSNGELVERAARLTRDIGREPATLEEAKKMLALA